MQRSTLTGSNTVTSRVTAYSDVSRTTLEKSDKNGCCKQRPPISLAYEKFSLRLGLCGPRDGRRMRRLCERRARHGAQLTRLCRPRFGYFGPDAAGLGDAQDVYKTAPPFPEARPHPVGAWQTSEFLRFDYLNTRPHQRGHTSSGRLRQRQSAPRCTAKADRFVSSTRNER